MANDAKLEQLKIAQDQAYKNKQSSYQEQQNSWDNLSKAKDKMNRLHEIKQAAFNDQERSWQEYQSVRNRNSPRIDQLNSAQEIAYANMKNAFDPAVIVIGGGVINSADIWWDKMLANYKKYVK